MSAATVRAQLQAFLATPQITGLERVYLSEPLRIAGGEWNLSQNLGWGAVGWPWITDEVEIRKALGAPDPANGQQAAGSKEITYKLSIVLLYQYLIPSAPTSDDAWQGPLDTIVEGVKARLRSDPKAGTGPGLDGVIFQQSQTDGDLHVMRDLPIRSPGKVLVWQRVDTTVTEIITA